MLAESRGLQSTSTCVLEVESGKLDIKRHGFTSWFTLQSSDYDVVIIFISIQRHGRCNSKSATSW